MIEEAFLQRHAIRHIEPFFVAARMSLQPLLLRRRLGKRLEALARVQAEAGPVGGTEERYMDLRPVRRLVAVPFVVHLSRTRVGQVVDAVVSQLLRRQLLWASRGFMQPMVSWRLGIAVLHLQDL